MDVQLGEILGLLILITIILYQEWTQHRIKKQIEPYKQKIDNLLETLENIDLKKASNIIIKFIEDIQKSGVLDKE